MADAVLLDVDGTLVDTVYLHVAAWHRAFLDHDIVVPCARLHAGIGMGGDRFVAWVAGDDVEQRCGDSLRARWEEVFDTQLDQIRPTNGAAELVRTLKERGWLIALPSSGKDKHLEAAREQLGVDDCIDAIVTSDDVERSKPDDDMLQVATERIGAGSPVLIGDAPWDAEAAGKAGMPVVLVRTGGFCDASLREAAGADTPIFDDPAQLLEHLAETPLGSR